MTSFCVLHRIGSIGPYEIIGLFVVVCVCVCAGMSRGSTEFVSGFMWLIMVMVS